jgi:RHS repeat-associated protein
MTQRTVDGAVSALTWDPMSNLVATEGPAAAGGSRVYVYDAAGQRVAQVQVSELTTSALPVAASVYVGDVQVDDADATLTGHVSGTRYVSFGGATVATVTVTDGGAPSWSLMFGDVQGSAQVVMGLHVDPASATGFKAASVTDGVQRTAYTPYGARRGTEDLDIDRGWLGQVEDTDTGLTYLNARYYDPVLSRFLSPDPLMNPGDPRTLDAYMYSSDNPVLYTDASGLRQDVGGAAHNDEYYSNPANKGLNPYTGLKRKSGDRSGVGTGSSGGAGAKEGEKSALDDVAEAIFPFVEGVVEGFRTVQDVADELVNIAGIATELSAKLRRGEKIGRWLSNFRLDRNPLLHYMAEWGRNPVVRTIKQLEGAEFDYLYLLVDAVGLYTHVYDRVPDKVRRWDYAAINASVNAGVGIAWDSGTDPLKDMVCGGSLGILCPAAIVGQGLAGWGIENGASNSFQSGVWCIEFGEGCPDLPQPTLYGVKDPDGNYF